MSHHYVKRALDEGGDAAVTVSFTGLGVLDTDTATIDWGDGAKDALTTVTSPFRASHLYADNGDYTVGVTVTDKDGTERQANARITVRNVAPTVAIGAYIKPQEVHPEKISKILDFLNRVKTAKEIAAAVEIPDERDVGIGVGRRILDRRAELGSFADLQEIADVPQVGSERFAELVASLGGIDEGDSASVRVRFTDPGVLDTHTASIDWGDAASDDLGTVTSPFIASHIYADNGEYTVAVTVTDKDGDSGTTSTRIVFHNVAPTVTRVDAPPAVYEGSATAVRVEFTDPGVLDTHTASIDWGDGASDDLGAVTSPFNASHVYADNGQYTISVTVTDKDGDSGMASVDLTVHNVAPTITRIDAPSAIDEGGAAAITVPFTDPGVLDTHTASIDWGDGASDDLGAVTSPFNASHVYADNGQYTIAVTVTDKDGDSGTASVVLNVHNVAPAVTINPHNIKPEDVHPKKASMILDFLNEVKTAQEIADAVEIPDERDVGIGVARRILGRRAELGAFTNLREVANVPQIGHERFTEIVASLAGGLIDEGDTVSFRVTFTDPGVRDTHIANIDWGDGASDDLGAVTSPFNASHVYADNGQYTIAVTVTDKDGDSGAAGVVLNVHNVAPTISTLEAPAAIDEGSAAAISVEFTDPGVLDTHIASIDWGDGTSNDLGAVTSPVSASHVYADDGAYAIAFTVTDKDGGVGTASVALIVQNVAPTVNAGPDVTDFSGRIHRLTASFTDPGVRDTHTATVDWGDGSPLEAGVVDESGGSGIVRGSHQYFVPGEYAITVRVVDKDGGEGSDSLIRTVVRLPVALNIKPGSDPNSINLRARVPVAILTTSAGEYQTPEAFDATEVDVSTVRFGPKDILKAGGGGTEIHGRGHIEDSIELDQMTKDGDLDMVLHFNASDSGFVEATTEACLQGVTSKGIFFEGCDSVRIVGRSNSPRRTTTRGKSGRK